MKHDAVAVDDEDVFYDDDEENEDDIFDAAAAVCFQFLIDLILYVPVNIFSVMSGCVFLGVLSRG